MKIHYLASFVFVGAILFAGAAKLQESSTTLKVVERATTDAVTDVGEEGDSVGDILTFANEVYDETNTDMIGTDNGYCVRTVVGESWQCYWSLTVKDGQIMVQGPFYDAGDSAMAIIGGTGGYANAHGQMSLHARNAEGSEYDFTYEIMR
ncbi:MAG: allene oxide cyclase family protein [Anaerolineae bacterium]